MNKRKTKVEQMIARKEDRYVKAVFEVVLRYLDVLDMDIGTNHYSIFKDVYLSKTERTYEQIALDNYISVDTLSRYLARYDRLVERIQKREDLLEI